MKKLFTTALIVATALTAQAQYAINGNASDISTKKLPNSFELTPDLGNQKGAVWSTNQIDISNYNFDLTFKANFGSKDANGADGIALVFQNDSRGTAALGSGTLGQYIGFQGVAPSLNVEFDTYNNGATAGDIAADHISVSKNGSTDAGNQLTTAVQASASNANIEDGQDHAIQITWNASSNTLSVYFDGSLRQTYANNLVQNIFGNNGLVYWGFTASTGGYTNQQRVYQLNMNLTRINGGKDANPLPVSLLNVQVESAAKGNRVTWATASEKNSAFFEIQRSQDARNWVAVKQVAAQGNSNSRHNYEFMDLHKAEGLTYYRLKMVDLDATFEYSRIVTVKAGSQAPEVSVYPNPARQAEALTINYSAAETNVNVKLLDALGNVVKAEIMKTTASQTTIATAGLTPGLYLVQVECGSYKNTTKVLIK